MFTVRIKFYVNQFLHGIILFQWIKPGYDINSYSLFQIYFKITCPDVCICFSYSYFPLTNIICKRRPMWGSLPLASQSQVRV